MEEKKGLTICAKCQKEIPSVSAFCMWCGAAVGEKKKKPTTHRPMNSGAIRKLSGRRERPYGAYLPRSMGSKYIGSFKTKSEASDALAVAIVHRPNTDRADWLINQFYKNFIQSDSFKNLSKSAQQSHRGAWLYFDKIENLKMRDIKKSQLQSVIDSAVNQGKSRAVCEKIRNLASLLCQSAMSDDVMDKNYATLLDLPKNDKKDKDIFTDAEISLLKAHSGDFEAKLILILIFSGMRVGELLTLKNSDININEWYAIGGNKTNAGKNRIIPFIKSIQPYVKSIMSDSEYFVSNSDGRQMRREYFEKYVFKKYLIEIGILQEPKDGERWRLSPHSCRHTFASLSRKAGIEKDVLTRVIGHTDYEAVTDKHYVDLDALFLLQEMSKLDLPLSDE